jgi:hypothetical protein
MSRKRCIRKHWGHMSDPITSAILGASLIGENLLDKLRMRELAAIESCSKGVGSLYDYAALCDVLNLAETMAGMGIGPEVLPTCEAAQNVMLEAKERYEEAGRVMFTGPALRAIRDLYEFHDLQRSSVDRSTYERAIVKTGNRIRSAHPSVKVLA